jgi:hypothetical protein
MRSPRCLCVCEYLPTHQHLKLGMYIMVLEPISVAHIALPKPFPSVCVSVCLIVLSLLVDSSVKTLPRKRITCSFGKIVERVFYAARIVSKERLWVCRYINLSMLGNGNEELLEASFSVRSVSYQRQV